MRGYSSSHAGLSARTVRAREASSPHLQPLALPHWALPGAREACYRTCLNGLARDCRANSTVPLCLYDPNHLSLPAIYILISLASVAPAPMSCLVSSSPSTNCPVRE
eukprot:751395-Hanusia_phi.AAC.1